MKKRTSKRGMMIGLCLLTTVACAAPGANGPDGKSGLNSALQGMAHLVLSPLQITAGLLEGISSMPYFLSMGLHELNAGMSQAQAQITLDDTYESAYGKRLSEVSEDGDTGELFRRMKHATHYFQKVLQNHGVPDWDRYLLTSIDTASPKGYTLFAVVYRPRGSITVRDKYDGPSERTLGPEERPYYEPFEKDAQGRSLDTIIDWAGLPRNAVENQKGQAILITMAANSVANAKRRNDYWAAEKRWIAGEYKQVTEETMASASKQIGV
jgi:hypothetical protein